MLVAQGGAGGDGEEGEGEGALKLLCFINFTVNLNLMSLCLSWETVL